MHRTLRRSPGSHRVRQHASLNYACESLERRTLLAFSVPILDSLPGAPHTIYLDFDGDPATLWANDNFLAPRLVHGPGGDSDPVPAFDWDGDPDNLNPTEDAALREIFAIAAEKFSPFNVNVTTVDTGNLADGVTQKVIIGGKNTDWVYSDKKKLASGVAAINGYTETLKPNTCYVFANSYVNNATFLGNIVVHEAGHAFGLLHQRTPNPGSPEPNEYYPGDTVRSPIMGSSGNQGARVIWWTTNMGIAQQSPDPIQNEIDILDSDLAFQGRRPDDYGFVTAPLGQLTLKTNGVFNTGTGVISTYADIDAWRFTSITNRATITVSNAEFGGMLLPTAKVRLESGGGYITANSVATDNNSVTLEFTSLTPGGNYILDVGSNGGYSELGQYRITGTMQTFASLDPNLRSVVVGGLPGNNNITLSTNPVLQTLIVTDTVNGATSSQSFPLSAVDEVSVATGNGDDIITVNGLFKNGSNAGLPVSVTPGGGTNTVRIANPGSFTTFNADGYTVSYVSAGIRTMSITSVGADRIEIYGSNAVDTFNLNSMPPFGSTSYYFYGSGSDDRMNIAPPVLQAYSPDFFFYGESGTDTLDLNASTDNSSQEWYFFNDYVSRSVPETITGISYIDFDSENVLLRTGAGDDFIKVYEVLAGKTITLNASGGTNLYEVGESTTLIPGLTPVYPFSQSIRGTINVTGGIGYNQLVVDDLAHNTTANYLIEPFGQFRNTLVPSGQIFTTGTVDRLQLLGVGGGTTTVQTQFLNIKELDLRNGSGNGAGLLVLDERSGGFSAPIGVDVWPDRIVNRGTLNSIANFYYSGFETLTLYTHNSTNEIKVYGTSPDITSQTTIISGTGSDVVTIYPHGDGSSGFAAGASLNLLSATDGLTLSTPLGYFGGGGSDTFRVDATASASPIDYLINNAGGSTTANIFGLGPAVVGAFNDVETVSILGGGGNDTFSVDSYKNGSALAINGGDGDDTVTVGAGDIPVNLSSIALFTFDGEGGNDSLNYNHSLATAAGGFSRGLGTSSIAVSTYALGVTDIAVEAVSMAGGSGRDQFSINAVAAGTALNLAGNSGQDSLFIPGSADLILGAIFFDTGADAGRISINELASTVGKTVHLDTTSVGAYPGDTFFGPGGSLRFTSLADEFSGVLFRAIDIRLGSGDDTVYAQPLETGQAIITAGGNTVATGDTLNLALAAAQDYVVTPSAIGAGSVISTSHVTLTYSGFESDPTIDNSTPAADIVDVSPDPRGDAVDSIAITFTEVVRGLDVADLSLTRDGGPNLLTGAESLTTADEVNFTLGELATLTSISGVYTLTLAAAGSGVADTFGNPIVGDVVAIWTLSLPVWLDPASNATWDTAGNVLSVAGAAAIIADPGTDLPIIDAVVPEAVVTFDPGVELQVHVGALNLSNGATASLAAIGAGHSSSNHRVLVVNSISIDGSSVLDLADNDLIVDYASDSPVGIWSGDAYDGITGYIQSGRIISSAASGNLKILGVAEAREALGISGTQTATFTGQAVDSTAVLVKFTWGGDANLDGKLNIDDYGRIDSSVAQSGSVWGWFNGDFNYDGKINIDDYGIIDSNIAAEGSPPLAAGSAMAAAPPSASSAEPQHHVLAAPLVWSSFSAIGDDEEDRFWVLDAPVDALRT